MAKQLFSNFAKTLTTSPIGTDDVVINVEATTGGLFAAPEGGDYQAIVLTDNVNYEIVHITARTGDELTVLRNREDTQPRPWALGTNVLAWNTKETMETFLQRSEYQPAVNIQNYRLFR